MSIPKSYIGYLIALENSTSLSGTQSEAPEIIQWEYLPQPLVGCYANIRYKGERYCAAVIAGSGVAPMVAPPEGGWPADFSAVDIRQVDAAILGYWYQCEVKAQ